MNGIDNEFQFVLALNRKKVSELNPMLYDLIISIFDDIEDDMIVKAWKNHFKQKTDVLIKIDNQIKRISIKLGAKNSVHVESIDSFINFLKENDVSNTIIEKFLRYHYADGTIDGTGMVRLCSKDYKKQYQNEIDDINKCFSRKDLLYSIISRCVTQGLVFHDNIDAIVYGIPNDFIYINKKNIFRFLCSKIYEYCSAPHFSHLVCQPLSRCLNYNPRYEYCRQYVQIKWYSLFDDILENMYLNCSSTESSF